MLATLEDKTAFLRCLDKYDRLGAEGVKALLTDGRRDESGDFTPGLGLGKDQAECVIQFLQTRGDTNEETLFKLTRWFAVMTMPEAELAALENALGIRHPEPAAPSEKAKR